MVAEGYDDCETDMLQRIRALVGPDAKIGVELDLHCDVTEEMCALADVIVLFKEYPHIDIVDRAIDLFHLIADAAEGKTSPTMGLFDCRMIGFYLTPFEPMRSFVDEMLAAEGRNGILSLSVVHCFPWADVPTTGARFLAVTDGDAAQAQRLAESWGRRFYALRHELLVDSLPMNAALDRALANPAGPVVVADQADNPGGGAPSDSTFVLRELLARGVAGAALAMIWRSDRRPGLRVRRRRRPVAAAARRQNGADVGRSARSRGRGPRHRARHAPDLAAGGWRSAAHTGR